MTSTLDKSPMIL